MVALFGQMKRNGIVGCHVSPVYYHAFKYPDNVTLIGSPSLHIFRGMDCNIMVSTCEYFAKTKHKLIFNPAKLLHYC